MKYLLSPLLLLTSFLIGTHVSIADDPSILLQGTWAIDIQKDPFANSYPAVAYLPAGTIIFDAERGRVSNGSYYSVQTQHGYWVQIAKEKSGGPARSKLEKLDIGLPSDSIFFHKSILCLSQTNRLVEPGDKCSDSKESSPVGEGWIFHFTTSQRPGWLTLKADLDQKTKAELIERGWDTTEAAFEIKIDEKNALEKGGNITSLDRRHPAVEFNNKSNKPFIIPCGVKEVTAEKLQNSLSADASADVGISFFAWLNTKLGISASSTAEKSTVYQIIIDTSDSSYLLYSVPVEDLLKETKYIIHIEKEFECADTPKNSFGEKIKSISFEIDYLDGADTVTYKLDNPDHYTNMPEDIYDLNNKRPLFISLNTPDSYSDTTNKIVEKFGIEERWLAEFITLNINYTCHSKTRKKCAALNQ